MGKGEKPLKLFSELTDEERQQLHEYARSIWTPPWKVDPTWKPKTNTKKSDREAA